MAMSTTEIECRFLEIDKEALIKKLQELGAVDKGEVMLEETIIYDQEMTWPDKNRFIRLRKNGDHTELSYKEHNAHAVDGTYEIEFGIEDYTKAQLLFERIGFRAARQQEKKRHTFELGEVTVDIDTWPRIPTYVELEGETEEALKEAAQKLGYDWKDADFHNAGWVIEQKYGIPFKKLRYYTFDRVE
jgi:adenylate cyclase class 2